MDLTACKKPVFLAMETGRSKIVHNRVYETLRYELMVGDLKPGQSVSIRYLVNRFNISTTPARQAIERLQAGRALVIGANRTPTVPVLNLDDLYDLRDTRVALEGLATEKANGCITSTNLMQLDAHVDNMYQAIRADNADGYLQNNWSFHHIIYQSAHSQLMLGIIETLWARAGPLFRLALPSKGHAAGSMVHHVRALEALKKGNAVVARTAIEDDIRGATEDIAHVLPD